MASGDAGQSHEVPIGVGEAVLAWCRNRIGDRSGGVEVPAEQLAVVTAQRRWVLPDDLERPLSAASVLLYLRGVCRPDPAEPPLVYAVELDGRTWAVATSQGTVTVGSGEPPQHDSRLRTDPETLNALLADPSLFEAALDDRTLVIDSGDAATVRRLFSG